MKTTPCKEMSRYSKTPFIPPLKLSASEDAVLRSRPQNTHHAPDDLPDPQGGGESSRGQHAEDSAGGKDEPQGKPTVPGQPKALDVLRTAATEEGAAVDCRNRSELEQSSRRRDENVQEAMSKTSRVRKLISLFDRNASTDVTTNELSPRHTHLGETVKFSTETNDASGGKITPCDNSDVDPDASDYTDGLVSTLLLGKEEVAHQNTRKHIRWLRQTEENKTSMEPRQLSVKITNQRNCRTGPKSRLSLVGNLSREHMSRSNTSADDTRGFKSNASTPVQSVDPAETRRVSKRSRLPVFKPEAKTLKDLTVTDCKRTSHNDYIPRQVPPTSGTKIRARWDGSPPKRGTSVGPPGESTRSSSCSRTFRKMIKDVTNLSSDEATELSRTVQKPEVQDTVANFALQPPCRPTNRLVFEPRKWAIGVESHLSHHRFSNWYAINEKPTQGLSCFLSLLWVTSAMVFSLVKVAASRIIYPLHSPSVLHWIRVPACLRRCPPPSSPGQLSQAHPGNQNGIWNRFWTSLRGRKTLVIRGVILFTVFLCCLELLVLDLCNTE